MELDAALAPGGDKGFGLAEGDKLLYRFMH
jgi:hypothetical protein